MAAASRVGIGLEAEVVCGMEEGQVPGLVDLQPVLVEHARVVLDEPVGDNNVPDPERRIQAAGHAGEDDHPRADRPNEERGRSSHGHLPDPCLGQDHGLPVQPAGPGADVAANPQRLPAGERLAQGGELGFEGGNDQDHGCRRLPEPLAGVWYGPRRCAG